MKYILIRTYALGDAEYNEVSADTVLVDFCGTAQEALTKAKQDLADFAADYVAEFHDEELEKDDYNEMLRDFVSEREIELTQMDFVQVGVNRLVLINTYSSDYWSCIIKYNLIRIE